MTGALKCWNCDVPLTEALDGNYICTKCEEEQRTCAFCGKVHASRESPEMDYCGVPYCKACVAGRVPDSYSNQDGCHNCALNFIFGEYDEGNTIYCIDGAPPRPPCGSVLMGEYHSMGFDEKVAEANMRAWDMWSLGREVKPWGKCGHWRRRDEPQENS